MTITLKDVGSGFKRTAINDNFSTIESELNNNVLRRDSATGNQMEANIDMNSNRLVNLLDAINGREPVTLDQLNGALSAASSGLIAAQQEQQTGAQVVAGVTTFTGITYTLSSNNLYVFRNGNYQTKGVDYNETSTSSITWTTVPNATDALVFITNLATTNSVANTSAISHTNLGTNHNLADFLKGNVRGDDDQRYRMAGCVIRQTGSGAGWNFIDDSGHAPTGFSAVALEGTKVRLTHSFTADKITSFTATMDDSFTALGVSVGASVGTGITDLEFYAPLAGGITGSASQGILGSTGSSGDFSQVVDTAAGTIVVTHATQTHVSALGTPVVMGNVNNDNHGRWTVSGQSKVGFTLNYVSDLAALIDGGSSTATTSNAGVSVVFDTTGGSEGYVITHPATASSNLNVQATATPPSAATALYHTRVESITTTTFKVAIFNAAGTRQTAASSSYDFMVRRMGDFPTSMPATTCGNVYRSAVPVDANELYNPSGNIWITADFESV